MRLHWNLMQFSVTTSDRSTKDKHGEGSPVQPVETGVSPQQTKDGGSSSASERRHHSCHQDRVEPFQLQNCETRHILSCEPLTCGPGGEQSLEGTQAPEVRSVDHFLCEIFLYSAQMSLSQPQTTDREGRTASEPVPRMRACTGQHLTESPESSSAL